MFALHEEARKRCEDRVSDAAAVARTSGTRLTSSPEMATRREPLEIRKIDRGTTGALHGDQMRTRAHAKRDVEDLDADRIHLERGKPWHARQPLDDVDVTESRRHGHIAAPPPQRRADAGVQPGLSDIGT